MMENHSQAMCFHAWNADFKETYIHYEIANKAWMMRCDSQDEKNEGNLLKC